MGRGIVLRRKAYAGFEVRTQGTFPQRTGGGCGAIFSVWLCFCSVLVSRTSNEVFHFPVFFLVPQAIDRIQILERKLKVGSLRACRPRSSHFLASSVIPSDKRS